MSKKSNKKTFGANLVIKQPDQVLDKDNEPEPSEPREDDASVLKAMVNTRSTHTRIPLSSVRKTVRKNRKSTIVVATGPSAEIEANAAIMLEAPEAWNFCCIRRMFDTGTCALGIRLRWCGSCAAGRLWNCVDPDFADLDCPHPDNNRFCSELEAEPSFRSIAAFPPGGTFRDSQAIQQSSMKRSGIRGLGSILAS